MDQWRQGQNPTWSVPLARSVELRSFPQTEQVITLQKNLDMLPQILVHSPKGKHLKLLMCLAITLYRKCARQDQQLHACPTAPPYAGVYCTLVPSHTACSSNQNVQVKTSNCTWQGVMEIMSRFQERIADRSTHCCHREAQTIWLMCSSQHHKSTFKSGSRSRVLTSLCLRSNRKSVLERITELGLVTPFPPAKEELVVVMQCTPQNHVPLSVTLQSAVYSLLDYKVVDTFSEAAMVITSLVDQQRDWFQSRRWRSVVRTC